MNEQRAKLVRIGELALLGLAALLTVYMAFTLISRLNQHGDFNKLLTRYEPAEEQSNEAESDAEPSEATEKTADKQKDEPAEEKPDPLAEQVKRITDRNLFSQPKAPPKFGGKLVGVLGDEAIFEGNKFAKVGQDIMGAKVTAMGPDWVEVEFQGKTIKQWVWGPRKGPPESPPNPDLSVDVPPDLLERFKGLAEDKQTAIKEKLPEEMLERLERAL